MSTSAHTEDAFAAAYQQLNNAQRLAVDTIEGPVMVIAGPGTGKTQILTLRIANILRTTQMDAENILALTFTESGAAAMRERLHRYIGTEAYQVPIYTFHGFAEQLMRQYPDAFPRMMGGRVVSDVEQVSILREIIDSGEFSVLRPVGSPYYYLKHVRSQISTLKREYISPDDLAQIIAGQAETLQGIEQYHTKGAHKGKVRGEYRDFEKRIAKNRELNLAYRMYEAVMGERKRYDFDDMIAEAVRVLESDADVRLDAQERYQYVLADEHQDVNGSQNRILELLCNFHDQPNIFVVGDEKQAIYRFQGASLENFLHFTEVFPDTVTIALTENYRSGQPVLDAAHALIASEDPALAALRVPLTAAAVPDARVERYQFTHQAVEDGWVADQVAAQVAAGESPAEIAVIVRSNQEVAHFADLLRKRGVAVAASADGDILNHPITQTVQGLIDFVLSDGNEQALFTVLHGAYWGLAAGDLVRIMHARSYHRSLTSILGSSDTLAEIGVSDVPAAQQVMSVLETARRMDVSEPPHRVLEYVLQASGYLEYITTHNPLEGVRVIRRLYDEVESLVVRDDIGSLKAVSAELALRREYGLPLSAPYITTSDAAVQVMTAHKSKGLEFDTVYVPHLTDRAWGGTVRAEQFKIPLSRFADTIDPIDDEQRLLYVAMTRARTTLRLSVASTSSEGKSLVPTRLFDACAAQLTDIDTTLIEQRFDMGADLRPAPAASPVGTVLLTHILKERGFSATSLNNYLKNPWDYFYRNVLRIPELQPPHMQFGTAVHAVLQRATHQYSQQGTLPNIQTAKEWLEASLGRLPLSVTEYTQLHEKGLTALAVYLPHLAATLPTQTLEEKKFSVVLETGFSELPTLPLTGNLDRIDLGSDGNAIRVLDYKTGKPKSRNVIEGKTQSSDGGYKRQLVFYALLLQLYGDERYQTKTGTLSFVEPKANGEIAEETYIITEEEIDTLKAEIIEAAIAIMRGDFLRDEVLAAESEYADLATEWLSFQR